MPISASRATLARIDAADIAGTRASPLTSAWQGKATAGTCWPSTTTSSGDSPRASTARFIASRLARRMFKRFDEPVLVATGGRVVHLREARLQRLARRLVVQPVAERLREIARSGVVLQELGNDEFACEDIGQAHVGQQRLLLHHPVRGRA